MIQAKVGLIWPSGFRGEDFLKSLQTDDGCQVMAIAHTGELKREQSTRWKIAECGIKQNKSNQIKFSFICNGKFAGEN